MMGLKGLLLIMLFVLSAATLGAVEGYFDMQQKIELEKVRCTK